MKSKSQEKCTTTIFLNNKGQWQGTVSLPHEKGEKRERKTFYGKSEAEAAQKAYSFIYQYENGDYVVPRKDTLISFLNDYHKICLPRWEETTSALYKMYIDTHFKPYFKEDKLKDIKPITLDRFYNYKLNNEEKKSKPMTINTVRKLNTFLKAAFNYAIKNGMIKTNPANCVILGRQEKYRPAVYDEEQFLLLLDAVKGTADEIPIVLGAGCGLRRGEVFGLQWNDINFTTNEIAIRRSTVRFTETIEKTPKTESSNRVIIAPYYVINVLSQYRDLQKVIAIDGKIVTSWKPGAYSEHFKKLLKKHNLDHIRFHDLRHYNAVIMLKGGISDKVASERLGHSQVSTLRNIYQHVLKDMDKEAAQEINKMFSAI